jgi:hypothetical protein
LYFCLILSKPLSKCVFGTQHEFPEAHTARFSAFLYAAAEVLLFLGFYQTFMQHVYHAKSKPGWTNLEKNIAAGLKCSATLTEICAAAIYLVVVKQTYILFVRSRKMAEEENLAHAAADPASPPPSKRRRKAAPKPRGEERNLLDLLDLHKTVVDFCARMAEDPGSLFDGDGYPQTFNGRDLPESGKLVIDTVRAHAAKLPHLKRITRAFFRCAHAKWLDFTTEFWEDAQIARLSPEQHRRAFLKITNDVNEGALGMLRVALRHAPNMSLRGFNTRLMLRQNNVVTYFLLLPTEAHAQLCAQARTWARGFPERQRRVHLAEVLAQKVEKNSLAEREKAARAEERCKRVQDIEVELDCCKIRDMKGAELDLQIERHWQQNVLDKGGKNVVCGYSKLRVLEKKYMLYGLVVRYTAELASATASAALTDLVTHPASQAPRVCAQLARRVFC